MKGNASFSNTRGFDFFFPDFFSTLKRIIWANQSGFKKSTPDVIFLKFQCFDNISNLRLGKKNLCGAFSLIFFIMCL